ncbi:MAG: TRAP transporter large permease subunit, partial [Hyphomicrobiaceae bacterium]
MAAFIAENMAPIMFASLVVFLLLGYPVAFSLAACGLLYFILGVELAPLSKGAISLSWPLLQSLPERIYGVMNNEVLLAVPFFTLMGLVLERSGMAEDLLDTIGQLFGTIRGGLAYAVVFVGALLAATTGVVAASVISMGLISLPIMLRYGYDRRLASGIIAASGTLAQIIPPSLVLIVMADQLGRSVGDMYEGAFIPGMVLSALYAAWIFIAATFFPSMAPGLPPEAVNFREPSRLFSSTLARISGLGVGLLAAYMLWSFSGGSLAGLAPPASIASTDGLEWLVRTVIPVLANIALAVAAVRRIFDGDDDRGLFSLTLLLVVSAVVGYHLMRQTTYRGADFVILCMAVTITL